jgi:uncharacterized protein YhbP (UPF0306 family)
MGKINLTLIAKKIIADNQYLTLATAEADGQPWVSVMVYAPDTKNNLYFMSLPSSRHGGSIQKDSRIAVAIFDSHQMFGEGVGLQIEGRVRTVPLARSGPVFKYYFGRRWPYGSWKSVKSFKRFFKLYKYRFYKIVPTKVWMNDPRQKKDLRVRIRLELLTKPLL